MQQLSYSQFHKWNLSNQEELLALLGLLTISIDTYIYKQAWNESLLEYERPVLEAHQFFGPAFTKNRLLMLHSLLHFWENEGGSNVWVKNSCIIECKICIDFWANFLHAMRGGHTEDFQIYILEWPWYLS